MTKRMLIDAIHPEETRVVTCMEDRIYDFDSETSTKKQLKGNIYLAKVSRVEPSLQAVFVDYGGNRNGFLPFSEIHPDYYRIPVEDNEKTAEKKETKSEEKTEAEEDASTPDAKASDENSAVTTINNNEDMFDEIPKKKRHYDGYRIQEVIQKRQILLIQVVKEERGNKGAALTTFLSMPGRYSVLMPNTADSGGISRKITNPNTRKRLRKLLDGLTIPDGVSVIIRTAGMERTKIEVKRDYDYLMRLWSEIRQLTLDSVAPNLIYEEDDLIKRSIRDLYTNDIDEILIEGEEAYKSAKNLMKMLMPSHAKRVQRYKDPLVPLFHRYNIERQLIEIHEVSVELTSGGTIVINPTEALVSVDVNSAKSTRLRHINETALTTNLEAAEEVARQLRLRDLGGLVVIDFIDMQDEKHNYQVENKLRDALRSDRARIQVGRISNFGLLEMSRQRIRPSIHEISSHECPRCEGTGRLRSVESSSLVVLRAIEEMGYKNQDKCINLEILPLIAFYLLNEKRDFLGKIEERYNIIIRIIPNKALNMVDFEMNIVNKEDASKAHASQAPKKHVHHGRRKEETKQQSEKTHAGKPQKSKPHNRKPHADKPHAGKPQKGQTQKNKPHINKQNPGKPHNEEQQNTPQEQAEQPVLATSDQQSNPQSERKPKRPWKKRHQKKNPNQVKETVETPSVVTDNQTVEAKQDIPAIAQEKPKQQHKATHKKPTNEEANKENNATITNEETMDEATKKPYKRTRRWPPRARRQSEKHRNEQNNDTVKPSDSSNKPDNDTNANTAKIAPVKKDAPAKLPTTPAAQDNNSSDKQDKKVVAEKKPVKRGRKPKSQQDTKTDTKQKVVADKKPQATEVKAIVTNDKPVKPKKKKQGWWQKINSMM